jgi:PqqD family protein of HPr-rel-A system
MREEVVVIGPNNTIRRKETYVDTELDDEIILMHVSSGQIFGMDEAAREIWKLLVEPITFAKLIETLLQQFEIDQATCEKDVLAFLAELENRGLIKICN